MHDGLGVAVRDAPAAAWPPDDTEESVVGTNLHQATITNLRLGLNELAVMRTAPGQRFPWQALTQTMITGLRRADGSTYSVLPDVFVHRRPIDENLPSIALAEYGPPALVLEVASRTTYQSDLDVKQGKGSGYARAGVAEYLVLDPTAAYVPEQGRGWRLSHGDYRPWSPVAAGRWRSEEVGVDIAMEGVRVVVHAPEGRRMLREGEIERHRTMLLEELARRQREYAEDLDRRDRRHAEDLDRLGRQYAEDLALLQAELSALRRRLEQLDKER